MVEQGRLPSYEKKSRENSNFFNISIDRNKSACYSVTVSSNKFD